MISEKHFRRLERFDEIWARRHGDAQLFTWQTKYVKMSQWIGVVQIPGLSLEILPKIDRNADSRASANHEPPTGDGENEVQREERRKTAFARANLLYMLAITGDLPLRERDLAALEARQSPLAEALIRIFASRLLDELKRGVESGYVHREGNLRTLKGKLHFGKHCTRNAAHQERFYVQYSEFLPDTQMNRIFKAACQTLLDATHTPKTQEQLRYCLIMLDDVRDVTITLADFGKVAITRQNERFWEVFTFCQMILSNQSPTASSGAEESFSLLFDMNVVFERFIAAFLQKHVMGLARFAEWHLLPQGKKDRRHLLEREEPSGKVLFLRPDLLFRKRGGDECFVIDTKWKNVLDSRGNYAVSPADFYQLHAYAHRYNSRQTFLLYPSTGTETCRNHAIIGYDNQPVGKQIGLRFVDLNRPLRKERDALRDDLCGILQDALPDVSGGPCTASKTPGESTTMTSMKPAGPAQSEAQ